MRYLNLCSRFDAALCLLTARHFCLCVGGGFISKTNERTDFNDDRICLYLNDAAVVEHFAYNSLIYNVTVTLK